MSTITDAITRSTTTTTTTNTATMMDTHSFKLPTFTPTQAEIWVMMAEDDFAMHKITNEQRKKLEIRIAQIQELRALTPHLWKPNTADPYNKLVSYLRKYGDAAGSGSADEVAAGSGRSARQGSSSSFKQRCIPFKIISCRKTI